jgi:hypothetical protein
MRPAIERALDEEPFAPHPVARAVDSAGSHDRGREAAVFQQDAFDLRLPGGVRVVARRDGRLRLRDRDRELWKVVDALGLVERAALLVGVDGRRGDCDERAGLELEQLLGVRGLERDDVDDEVEAVGDGERAVVVSVEGDVVEARRRRPLGLSRNGDLPGVSNERARDGRADVAGAAEDEDAPRDRSLDDHDGIADADLAVGEDVGIEAAAVDERFDHARLRHRLEVRAGLAELDAFAFDIADAKALADKLVYVDPAREDVAPRCCRLDRQVPVLRDGIHRFGCDQRDRASRRRVALGPVVTVALESASRIGTDPLDRSRQVAPLSGDENRFDLPAHRLDTTGRVRHRQASRS